MHAYLKLILEKFDCYGTWRPGTPVYVGEIGKLIGGGSFDHTGDIKDRTGEEPPKITPVKEPPQQAMVGATASLSAGGGVEVGEIVQALTSASASVTMKMAKRNSAALVLEQVTRQQFSDERTIRQLMEMMLSKGLIDLDEVVVTYILEADSGIVAASSASEISGEGETDIDLGVSEFKLGKVNGRLAVVSGETADASATAEEGVPLTPMYRALFFRGSRTWWHFWKVNYTIDALIESAASLRAHSLRGRLGEPARVPVAWYGAPAVRGGGRPSRVMAVDMMDAVSSSKPSLALAEQALQELRAAAPEIDGEIGAEPLFGAVQLTPTDEVRIVDVYNNLGNVLRDRGDLAGAQRQYEHAVEWVNATATGRLPHESDAEASQEVAAEAEAGADG